MANTIADLLVENEELRRRLEESEAALRALASGEADAILVQSDHEHVRTLEAVDTPYRLLVEQIPQGAATLNTDGIILYANARFADLLRRTPRSVSGQPLAQYTAPGNLATLESLLRAGLDGQVEREIGFLLPDGHEVSVYLNIRAQQEGALGQCLVVTDVTEQKHYEELQAAQNALRQSEERFRLAAEAVPGVVYEWDVNADTVFRSGGFVDLVGFDPDEVPDGIQWWLDQVHPDDRIHDSVWQQVAHGDHRVYSSEYRVRHANGHWVHVWDRGVLVRDASGKAIRAVGTSTDVTARKQVEQKLAHLLEKEQELRGEAERANLLKDQFLATVSHELRTPLNVILGWTPSLLGGQLEGELVVRALEAIDRNARIQARLIEDILDVSRITSGKLNLEIANVDLLAIAQAAIETLRPAANAKKIDLTMTAGPLTGTVRGDATRLQQVVWNLISNAVKFTPAGGQVRINLECAADRAIIAVRDSGAGISPEFLSHVFERFQQADGASTRRFKGLGLGLAIARHLVELHGGTIVARSEGIGHGAEFTVSLPLAAGDELPHDSGGESCVAAPANGRAGTGELYGLNILIVDDELDVRHMLEHVLASYGAKTRSCDSVRSALAAIEEWDPNLLIADIGMPDQDGYNLIAKIRAARTENKDALRAIALSGYARAEDENRALRAGFDRFLAKPADPDVLLAMIGNLLHG